MPAWTQNEAYIEIRKGMYLWTITGWHLGQPTAEKRLAKYGYYKVPHMPCQWKKHSKQVADKMNIKYVNK